MATPHPPRPSTAGGESSESLKRKYKQLEANHKDWQEQVQKDLHRQKLELDSLKRDNEQYKQELNELRVTETTTAVGVGSLRNPNSKSYKRNKELETKREMMSHLEARCRGEQQHIEEINKQVDECRGTAREARKDRGGVNVTQESYDAVNRQIQILENRLDQSLVQFNEALRQNKVLRDQIDTLRGERAVFESIYEKLEAELQEKKKEMAFIIEVSNIAYEERDNNVQVLANLKEFAADELKSFAETFKELDDLLEEDRKVKEAVKQRIATLTKSNEKEDDLLVGPGMGSTKRKTQLSKSQSSPATTGEGSGSALAAQLAEYEEAFFKIRKATDIPDLKDLVQRFLHSEEDNFSLFSYVNDLSKEIEVLESQRDELLSEIEKIAIGTESEQDRREVLKGLEDKLRVEEQKTQRYIEMSLKTEGILRGAMTSIEHIFTRLDCDESTILEQHGVSGLSLETLLLYLASIELRTDEYLVTWAKQNGTLGEGFGAPRGPLVPYDSMQVAVDPKKLPGTGEDAEGSDEDDHPLSRDELLRKAQKKLNAQALAATERRTVRGGKPKVGISMLKK